MTFDIIGLLQVAQAAFELGITFNDAQTLYKLYTSTKSAGKVDFAALAKSGALQTDVDAIARVSTVLSKLLADPTQGPRVKALLAGLST